jgi:hypothetical protein
MFYLPNGQRINVPYGQYVFFAVGLITSVILIICYKRQIFRNTSKFFLLLLFLLFGICFISGILGLAPFYSIRLLVIVFITSLPFMLIGILSANFLRSKVVYPILFFGFLSAFGAIFLEYYGSVHVFGLMINNFHWEPTRWSFVFCQANGLGDEIALTIAAFLYGILVIKGVKKQVLILLLLLPLWFVLYKTNSRSAILLTGFSVFVFCIVNIFRLQEYFKWSVIKRNLILLSFLIICTLLAIVAVIFASHYFRIDISNMNSFTSARWQYWMLILKGFNNNLFFGYGYGGTQMFLKNPDIGAYNIYIDLAGQTGLFGLGALLLFWFSGIFLSIKYIIKSWNIDRNLSFFAVFILMLLGGMVLEQLGDSFILFINKFNFVFFFAIAAAYALPFAYKKAINNVPV